MNDQKAWEKYPKYRYFYNKLDLSLRLGYEAGPACVPIRCTGNYIVRPIYNLYGMGVGAHKIFIDIKDAKSMEDHDLIPPGYFWCEEFKGIHYSVDFKRSGSPKNSIFYWEPYSAMIGEKDKNDLTLFKSWVKIDQMDFTVPYFCNDIEVDNLNIEYIGDKVIEIHLRTGNNIMYNLPMGTKLVPVWDGFDEQRVDIENEEDGIYDASGYLPHVRKGYRIEN